MKLIEDVNNKIELHVIKNRYWKENGVEVLRYGLPVADYVLVNDKIQDVLDRKAKRGIEPKKMDFLGTYAVAVDTKRDMNEIEGNIVGKAHARFRDELILAKNNGIKLYVLVENTDGIKETRDVFKYTSKRRLRWFKYDALHRQGRALNIQLSSKPPISGEQLAKAILTMELKYGVKFLFCKPTESGKIIIDLLTGGNTENA